MRGSTCFRICACSWTLSPGDFSFYAFLEKQAAHGFTMLFSHPKDVGLIQGAVSHPAGSTVLTRISPQFAPQRLVQAKCWRRTSSGVGSSAHETRAL